MLTLVHNDEGDWVGLYGHDGRLLAEGHSFAASQLLELAGVRHDLVWDVDLSETGRLPTSLGGVASLPGAKTRREVRPA